MKNVGIKNNPIKQLTVPDSRRRGFDLTAGFRHNCKTSLQGAPTKTNGKLTHL